MMSPLVFLQSGTASLRNYILLSLFVMSAVLHMHMTLIGQNFPNSYYDSNYRNNVEACKNQKLMDLPHDAQQHLLNSVSDTSMNNNVAVPSSASENSNSHAKASSSFSPSTITSGSTSQNIGLHAPNSTMLPMPNENGIIIFYYHIPKTGGTTQMAPFARNPDWRYRMVFGYGKQKRYSQEMYSWLENWEPDTRVYYEYHAGKASPYMDQKVRNDVYTWRAMAKDRNIPFFAFTVVREPLSFAISHFNFYYASGKTKDPRYYWRPDPTEEDFLELSLPNPQCLFAVRSEIAYYEEYREAGKPVHVSKEGCQSVYEAFVHDFDWIGTTETLSTQTFPILEQVGMVRYCPEIHNQSKNKISKSTLSAQAVLFVRNTTTYDQYIYDRAVQDFPFSMWKNFDATPKPPLNPKKRCKYKTGQPLPPGELPKRKGERRRFLEANPDFVPVKDRD